jgi:thiamine biosynthesis lipoprotein
MSACTGATGSADSTGADTSGIQENTGFAMGTVVNQTIYTKSETVSTDVIDLLTEVENKWLSRRVASSEIGQINANAKEGLQTTVSYEMREYLNKALSIAEDSDGAFDPTIGYLSELWGFDEGKDFVPDDAKIKDLLRNVGYEHISIEGDTVSMPGRIALDFGGIGKGIGCDEIEAMLRERKDVTGGIFNIGGSSILTYGEKNTGENWKVAITNPTKLEDFLGVISIKGTKHISTSGDYEKYFEANGRRYHHILDPATGYPTENNLRSVTIVSDAGTVSEGLSTASFVLGKDAALKLIEDYGAEAIFVDDEKHVYVTEGLEGKFEILADDYRIM